jgi:hypothetical protein
MIPNLSYPEIQAVLNSLIQIRETEYLKDALGYEFFSLFSAGILVATVDQRYTDLLTGANFTDRQGNLQRWPGFTSVTNPVSPISDYVYYYWLKHKHTQVMEVGIVQTDNQNAKLVSPKHKACDAWNSMVDRTCLMYEFLMANILFYPEFQNHSNSKALMLLTTKINPFF